MAEVNAEKVLSDARRDFEEAAAETRRSFRNLFRAALHFEEVVQDLERRARDADAA